MTKFLQIEEAIFTDQRLRLWGPGGIFVLVFAIIWIAFFEGGGWPYLSNGTPKCIDFGWMWLSAKFAVTGELARIFDYPAFSHAQTTFLALFCKTAPTSTGSIILQRFCSLYIRLGSCGMESPSGCGLVYY